jgi:hypothetical protein
VAKWGICRYCRRRRCWSWHAGASNAVSHLRSKDQTHVQRQQRTAPPPRQQLLLNQLWQTLPATKRQEIVRALSRIVQKALRETPPGKEVTYERH